MSTSNDPTPKRTSKRNAAELAKAKITSQGWWHSRPLGYGPDTDESDFEIDTASKKKRKTMVKLPNSIVSSDDDDSEEEEIPLVVNRIHQHTTTTTTTTTTTLISQPVEKTETTHRASSPELFDIHTLPSGFWDPTPPAAASPSKKHKVKRVKLSMPVSPKVRPKPSTMTTTSTQTPAPPRPVMKTSSTQTDPEPEPEETIEGLCLMCMDKPAVYARVHGNSCHLVSCEDCYPKYTAELFRRRHDEDHRIHFCDHCREWSNQFIRVFGTILPAKCHGNCHPPSKPATAPISIIDDDSSDDDI